MLPRLDSTWDIDIDKRRSQAHIYPLLGGLAIILAGSVVLAWNESSAVCDLDALYTAQDVAVVGSCHENATHYEGKLVFLSCPILDVNLQHYKASSTDARNAKLNDIVGTVSGLCFKQRVEVYQCEERKVGVCVNRDCTKKDFQFKYETGYYAALMNSTDYSTDDKGHVIDSAAQKRTSVCGSRENPESIPTELQAFAKQASSLKMGGWTVRNDLLDQLVGNCDKKPIEPRQSKLGDFGSNTKQPPAALTPSTVTTSGDNMLYSCSSGKESVGCIRLSFTTTSLRDLSLLYEIKDGRFHAYRAPETWLCGERPVSYLVDDHKTFDEAFDTLRNTHVASRWWWRLLGFGVIFGGLSLVFLHVDWLAYHVGCVDEYFRDIELPERHFIVALLAIAISLITISILWTMMQYRRGLILLAVGLLLVVITCALGQYARKRRELINESRKKCHRSRSRRERIAGVPEEEEEGDSSGVERKPDEELKESLLA